MIATGSPKNDTDQLSTRQYTATDIKASSVGPSEQSGLHVRNYSAVSNIGYIRRLEQGPYEARIILEIY